MAALRAVQPFLLLPIIRIIQQAGYESNPARRLLCLAINL